MGTDADRYRAAEARLWAAVEAQPSDHRIRLRRTGTSLFLWGTDDPFGGEAIARAFVARIPGARLELLAGAGHAVWLDEPDAVAAAVSDFLVG